MDIPIFLDTRALIFDIDGTLVDTLATHYRASQIVCNANGFDFPIDFFYQYAGVPTVLVFKTLVAELGLNLDGETLAKEKEEKYLELIDEVQPLRPIYEIAVKYKYRMPIALGTGGTREIAMRTLEAAGIANEFPVIITSDDVKNGKPAPDTFLLCAERMGVAPQYCQVFEDGEAGIAAAHAAGMSVIDIRNYVQAS